MGSVAERVTDEQIADDILASTSVVTEDRDWLRGLLCRAARDGAAAAAVAGTRYPAELVTGAIERLTAAIEAATAPASDDGEPSIDCWARVELFGHTVAYGRVRDVRISGRRFLNVHQPPVGSIDGAELLREQRDKLYHPNAVYALEETSEDDVMDTLRRQCGLFKWRDGSWHEERETFALEVDMDALERRGEHDEEDIDMP